MIIKIANFIGIIKLQVILSYIKLSIQNYSKKYKNKVNCYLLASEGHEELCKGFFKFSRVQVAHNKDHRKQPK